MTSRSPLPLAAPIVKWAGGKTKLLPDLLARMPVKFDRYFEPFVGGAALFFRVAPERAVLNDFNPDLVNLYRAIATNVSSVIRALGKHRTQHARHDKEHYYKTRARWNDPTVTWSPHARAAAFVYLNKTCFNGLWRVNRAGAFNVPMGRYTDPAICVPAALLAAQQVLARADLRCGDYRAVVTEAARGDFAYFDPPYDPLTSTASFTSYTVGAFGPDQQAELADTARQLVARGCRVMLSNSDTPLIRKLYRGFQIDRVMCARSINSNAAKRGAVGEVIVTGR